jgi:hypothetical protein
MAKSSGSPAAASASGKLALNRGDSTLVCMQLAPDHRHQSTQ